MKIQQKIEAIKESRPEGNKKLKKAQASLTHEDLLQQITLLKSFSDHISVVDKELTIIWANDTAMRIFGDDIIGKKCYEVYYNRKEPCEPYPCLALKAFEDGNMHEHDTQVIDKKGRVIYFHCTANVVSRDKNGTPTAVVELSRDITKQKKSEEQVKKYQSHLEELVKERTAKLTSVNKKFQEEIDEHRKVEETLRNERQRFFSLLDELPALVYLQAPDYSIRYANRYFREHFGDPTGKYCHEVLMKCKKPCNECPTFRVFATQKPQQWEITAPDGKSYEVYDYPFTDIDGSLLVLDLSIDVTDRKKMEEELRKSEERWRKYFELGLIGIAVTTPEKGFIAVNDYLCDTFGYSRDEFMKMTWAELIYPADLDSIVSEFNQVLGGEKDGTKKEMRSIRKDRSVITISLSAKCLRHQDGSVDYCVVFVQDITELKNTMEQIQYRLAIEEALAKASKMLISSEDADLIKVLQIIGETISATRASLFQYRENESKAYMTHEWCSPGVKPYKDVSQDFDSTGFPWLMKHFKNKEAVVISDINTLPPEASAEKEYLQGESIRSLLGMPIFPLKGKIVGFMVLTDTQKCHNWATEDIRVMHIIAEMMGTYLERRHTEQLLEESENKYSTLVEQALDAIVIVQDWVLKFINKAGVEMIGYTKEEEIGRPFLDLLAPEVKEKLVKIHTERISGSPAPLFYESKIKCKDGTIKDVDMFIGNIKYNGKPATMGIVRDITERKRMEKELQKIQKLESVGMLAGGIAHDFNNILTTIMGNISLIELYKESGNDISSLIKPIKKASHRAKNITQQLITFAKGGAPIKKAVSVSNLLKDIVNLTLSGSKVKCELSISDDLWWSELDEGQMNQAMSNLLINADQAMPEGGIISLNAKNINITEGNGSPLKDGKYIKISIADEGIGIPKEYLHKIFDPYFTTKPKQSGLGLAISYSIINKHDGYITAESEMEVGSTFIVYLPAVEKEDFTVKKVLEEKLHTGKGNILLMDDQQGVRDTAEAMLSYLGYEVEVTKDGGEAIELYKKKKDSGQGFDAVILDLTVSGGMGGLEAVQKLRQIDPEVKAIVSSGYSNNPVITGYKNYGFSGVVTKPYEIKELSNILHKMIHI